MKITNDQEWEQYLESVKVSREVFALEATEAVMDKAKKGDMAACEWLEQRGLFKFPTTLNRCRGGGLNVDPERKHER